MQQVYKTKSISQSFILGKCNCGHCNDDIPIKSKRWVIQKYKHGHLRGGFTQIKGAKHYRYKGYRIKTRGYIKILKLGHPYGDSQGYVLEHRLVLEEYYTKKWGYKFYIHPSLVVHHINGIKTDNRIENLQILTKSQHRKHHIELQKRLKMENDKQTTLN